MIHAVGFEGKEVVFIRMGTTLPFRLAERSAGRIFMANSCAFRIQYLKLSMIYVLTYCSKPPSNGSYGTVALCS